MWISQFINGMVLPIVLVFMIILINDRRIMGEYRNSALSNVLSVICILLVSLLSLALVASSILERLGSWPAR
jgi:Mn2+/Fe2+ NRAMP family transporter